MSETSTPNIPGYKIIKTLGHGGMAIVYLAIQQGLNRRVALKVMSRQLSSDERFCRRFRREAEIVGQLNSTHIIPVYEVGEHDGVHYLSMEYLTSGTLTNRIMQGIDPGTALEIAKQVAVALKTAHEHDAEFIHRDVKPDNILFRDANTAVLTDFGIAGIDNPSDSETALTKFGHVIGSPKYMSPEQTKGEKLNPQTDLYSLGVVLFQMLTKQLPYDGLHYAAIALKQFNEPIPSLPRNISYLQPLIDKALAKDKSKRFKHAAEFIEAISAIQSKLNSKNKIGIATIFKWQIVLAGVGILLSVLTIITLLHFTDTTSVEPRSTIPATSHKLEIKTRPENARIYLVEQERFMEADEILEAGTLDISVWSPNHLIADLSYKHPSNNTGAIALRKIKNPTAHIFYRFLDALESEIPGVSDSFIDDNPFHPLGEILRVAILKDYSKLEVIKRHARIGDEQSLLILSELHDDGWGVEEDKGKALDLASRAAQYGYSLAQVQYATLILNSNPTAEQIEQAVDLYDQAASDGFFLALNRRGKLYINGTVGPRNLDKGLEFLAKAASQGDRDALFVLGQLYDQGLDSIPQNKSKAKSYLEHAAELGDRRAHAYLR